MFLPHTYTVNAKHTYEMRNEHWKYPSNLWRYAEQKVPNMFERPPDMFFLSIRSVVAWYYIVTLYYDTETHDPSLNRIESNRNESTKNIQKHRLQLARSTTPKILSNQTIIDMSHFQMHLDWISPQNIWIFTVISCIPSHSQDYLISSAFDANAKIAARSNKIPLHYFSSCCNRIRQSFSSQIPYTCSMNNTKKLGHRQKPFTILTHKRSDDRFSVHIRIIIIFRRLFEILKVCVVLSLSLSSFLL